MLRIKIAAGVLTPAQLRVLAVIADEYSTAAATSPRAKTFNSIS